MEGDNQEDRKALLRLMPREGKKAQVVGITGPPGIGKSTLIGILSSMMAVDGIKPSILAIDASSPFSGGSLLGNRIRMQDNLRDSGIFMRSLANRGEKGGLSRSAIGSTRVLEGSGSMEIIIETVGSGQADLDIMRLADTIVLVLAPGLGDEIQAIKAGIMEISNIFVINKMDREGSYFAMKDIEDTVVMDSHGDWKRPVIGTSKNDGKGYRELNNAIMEHRKYLEGKGELGRNRELMEMENALEDEIEEKITHRLKEEFSERHSSGEGSGSLDPYEEAESMLRKFMRDYRK